MTMKNIQLNFAEIQTNLNIINKNLKKSSKFLNPSSKLSTKLEKIPVEDTFAKKTLDNINYDFSNLDDGFVTIKNKDGNILNLYPVFNLYL